MIIVSIFGGLGNQMFQYAAARRLAHHHGTELKLDLSAYRSGAAAAKKGLEAFKRPLAINQFNIAATEASESEIDRLKDRKGVQHRLLRRVRRALFGARSAHVYERAYRFDRTVLDLPSSAYLQGFWQSEKYFDNVADVIRRDFTPRDPAVLEYARHYVNRLKAEGKRLVSLHVRRGDLAHATEQLSNVNLVHGAPVTLDYINRALREFDETCQFLVFSDSDADIKWCRDNIRADRLNFSEGHSAVQDMIIMSLCDDNIIANSTYSWWAAWLNRNPAKRVISPSTWAHQAPGKKLFMVTDDLIPASWRMI